MTELMSPEHRGIEYSDDILSPSAKLVSKKRSSLGSAMRLKTPIKVRSQGDDTRIFSPNLHKYSIDIEDTQENKRQSANQAVSAGSVPWHLDHFTMSKPLGKGKFGNVYHAKQKTSGAVVALKVMFKAQMINDLSIKMLKREVEIQYRMHHPNILSLYGCFQDLKHVYLILEFAEGGEYWKMVTKSDAHFDERTCWNHIQQLNQALCHLHSRHVVHRDIKPENVLIGADGSLKLADFGSAVHAPPPRHQSRYTMCGTPEYLAPEMIQCTGHGIALDMWACGILMYEIMYKRTPFTDTEAKKKRRRDSPTNTNAVEEDDKEQQAARRTLYQRILQYQDGGLLFQYSAKAVELGLDFRDVSSRYRDVIKMLIRPDPRQRLPAHALQRILTEE